jgi:PadR family transcriptional regulator, regulatory protein PadR
VSYILNKVKHIDDYDAPVLGELEFLVLLAVLRLGNGTYGADIRREILDRTTREVPVSSIYVTLDRLEKKRLVVSYVGNPTPERGGRRRTHYLLDTEGEKALGRAYRTLRSMTDGVAAQLEQF